MILKKIKNYFYLKKEIFKKIFKKEKDSDKDNDNKRKIKKPDDIYPLW